MIKNILYFIYIIIYLLCCSFSFKIAAASEKIIEVWQGEFQLGNYKCKDRAVDEIIFDGSVKIHAKTEVIQITCPEISFRNAGKIIVESDFKLSAKRLAGSLYINSINTYELNAPPLMRSQPKARSGMNGKFGRDARSAPIGFLRRFPIPDRTGEHGAHGIHGKNGANGKSGKHGIEGIKGHNLFVSLDWIDLGSSITLISIGSEGQNGQQGQSGGDGGDGGNGGDGGEGSDATYIFTPGHGGNAGNGGCSGQGGDGGRGGDGGNGGSGGDVRLSFTENSFKLSNYIPIRIKSIGGKAGLGGLGGDQGYAGKPGKNGLSGKGGTGYAPNQVPLARPGYKGSIGCYASNGRSGKKAWTVWWGGTGSVIWGKGILSRDAIIERLLEEG